MGLQVTGPLAGLIRAAIGDVAAPITITVIHGRVGDADKAAINEAKGRDDTIIVALVDVDDRQEVFHSLARVDLFPEEWGGDTVTVDLDPLTGEGLAALRHLVARVAV